jgi:hypothetical protein
MALKCLTDISHFGEKEIESVHERILDSFIRAGENFIIQARNQFGGGGGGKEAAREAAHALGLYADDTTNLRNSIGYYIFHKGEMVYKNTDGKGSAHEGESTYDLGEALEKIDPSGYQLIGFAGMNYASYVEAKGYNVITTQSETCILNLTGFLQRLGLADKDFNELIQDSLGGGDYEEGL